MYSHNSTFKSKPFKKLAVLASIACLSLTMSTTLWAKKEKKDSDSMQTANIVDFHKGVDVAGAGTLTRTKKLVTAGIFTTGLDPSAAYTIWWIVWNDPSACVGGCGEDDLEIAGNSIFYAGGFVTGEDGSANVIVQMTPGVLNRGIEVFAGKGLDKKKVFKAEIHLIIRSHGPLIKGLVDLQIGTFDGGCGMEVPDPCHDHQAVAFLP
jgi:hypothetical protein